MVISYRQWIRGRLSDSLEWRRPMVPHAGPRYGGNARSSQCIHEHTTYHICMEYNHNKIHTINSKCGTHILLCITHMHVVHI
jgi:hypothetical protein